MDIWLRIRERRAAALGLIATSGFIMAGEPALAPLAAVYTLVALCDHP